MKSYQINQIKLIAAISHELNRQHPGLPADGRMNKVIEAANLIVAEYGRAYVSVVPGMGLNAWLNSDETGSSSRYMAFVLSGGTFGDWWGRTIPESAYPRDPDDFGRCLKLLQAVPEFQNNLSKMNDCGPEWQAVVQHWERWAELHHDTDGHELYVQMQNAFESARGII